MTYEQFIAVGPQADVLRILRICMDWSILDTASKLGISASYISEVERGKKHPSDKILWIYTKCLELPEEFIEKWIDIQKRKKYTYQKLLLKILLAMDKMQRCSPAKTLQMDAGMKNEEE